MTTIPRLLLVFLCCVRILAAPANDDFEDAILLTNHSFTTNAPVLGATSEFGEPLAAVATAGTVWYTFVPPAHSAYLVWSYVPPWFPSPLVHAYRGTSVTNLIPIPNNFTNGEPRTPVSFRFTLRAGAGETIHLQLANRSEAGWIEFGYIPAPPNDDFSNALLLTNLVVSGTTQAASAETGDIDNKTLWYKWEPGKSTTYNFALRSLSSAHRLFLFDGDALAHLKRITQVDTSFSSSREASTNAFLVGSNTYYIAVGGPNIYSDQFEFEIAEGVENDSFFTPGTILVGETIHADTTGASREPNEPFHHGTNAIHTLWYEFTAHETGGHYIERPFDLTPPGFSIYQGGGIGALTEVPQTVYATSDSRTIITFRAVAGQKYAIALHDHLERTNQFSMRKGVPRDEFENAAEITLGTDDLFDALAATIQPGEAAIHEFQNSVWHRFTAPTNGGYFAQTQGGGYPLVFRGNSFSNLVLATPLHRERYIYGFPFYASAGETLYIAVVDTAGYRLRVDAAAPNDQFTNRAAVFSERMVSTNGWATLEPGEPVHSTNFRGGSLWWKWIATNSVPHRILATAGFAGSLALYRGSELTNLTLVATAETFDFGLVGLGFIPDPGFEYAICLSYLPAWDNPVILTFQTPPPHDHFADAISIVTGNPLTNVIGIATLEPGETWSTNKGTVWYSWTAPSSGPFAFLPGNAVYDYDLHVFTGSALDSLQPIASLFAGGYKSGVSFRAVEGTRYFIAVALSSSVFSSVLQPTIVAGPTNDNLANATELSGTYLAWAGTTVGASSEGGESTPDDAEASVWARWTAPHSGIFRLMSTNGWNLRIAVKRGDDPLRAATIGTNRLGGIEFFAQEGATYFFRAASGFHSMTSFLVRLGPIATNDTITSAIELSGTSIFYWTPIWSSPDKISNSLVRHWYQWTAPAFGILQFTLVTNDQPASIQISHLRRPTLSTNIYFHLENASRYKTGSFAVSKGVTYLFGLHSAPTTNLFLKLQFENSGNDLGSYADSLVWGSIVPFIQTNRVFSPPDALQLGPIAPGLSLGIERVIHGRGYLVYRIAAEGASFDIDVHQNPYSSGSGSTAFATTFDWRNQVLELTSQTNVIRWSVFNRAVPSQGAATIWLDDFEFVPAVSVRPTVDVASNASHLQMSFLAQGMRTTGIEYSTNLLQWLPWTNMYSTRSSDRSFSMPIDHKQTRRFFRVRVSR